MAIPIRWVEDFQKGLTIEDLPYKKVVPGKTLSMSMWIFSSSVDVEEEPTRVDLSVDW